MHFDDPICQDPRITGLVTDLLFPDDCEQAPGGPGVCLVVCPNGTPSAVASGNLRDLLTRPADTGNLQWAWRVTRELGLPLRGRLLFLSTVDLADAENLREEVLERIGSANPVRGESSLRTVEVPFG